MELLCLFLCLWTLEILKKYQLIKAWQGRFLNKLAKVWYDIIWGMESSVVGQNWIQVKNCNWWFSISVMVSYPQFMNNCRVLGQRTWRINLGSKILSWLNSFVPLQTDICIFALSLLIVLHVPYLGTVHGNHRVGKKPDGLWKFFLPWRRALCFFLEQRDRALKKNQHKLKLW